MRWPVKIRKTRYYSMAKNFAQESRSWTSCVSCGSILLEPQLWIVLYFGPLKNLSHCPVLNAVNINRNLFVILEKIWSNDLLWSYFTPYCASKWVHLLFYNYSCILGAPHSAILFIDVTIEVKMDLITHYEFVNKLVFSRHVSWKRRLYWMRLCALFGFNLDHIWVKV